MDVAVVCESMFGNTRIVAEAIAEGLRAADSHAQVAVVPVVEATSDKLGDFGLLIVGGPTHLLRMTSPRTRRMGLQAGRKAPKAGTVRPELEAGAAGPGVREWLDALPTAPPGLRAAAFDTRLGYPLAGGAARSISRRLHGHGYEIAAKARGFIVQDAHGPLKAGERDRAREWGAGLVRQSVH